MKPLKPFVFFLFLMPVYSAFCQLEQLKLQVLDLETAPAFEKSMDDVLVEDDQIFIITRNNGVYDLIVYDGEEVTEIIKDSGEDLNFLGPLNGGILLMIGTFSTTQYLYFLDVADYSLTELSAFEDDNYKAITFLDNKALFLDYGEKVYSTDGTIGGTFLIQDFVDMPQDENLEFKLNGSILFNADDQLWRTDGTLAGTYSFSSQAYDVFDEPFIASGNLAYYSVNNDLWVTDGTSDETQIISNNTGFTFTHINHVTNTDSGIVFIGKTAEHGYEIWGADGTPNGTQLLADMIPGPEDGVNGFFSFGLLLTDNLMILRGEGSNSSQVWSSDGTAGGTQLLIDFAGQANYNDFDIAGPYQTEDGKVFFSTRNDADEGILWLYDANTNSAVQISVIPDFSFMTAYSSGSKLFFQFYEGGDQLWVSDGTPNGTLHLTTITSNLEFIGTHNDLFYYRDDWTTQSTVGFELFVSDGTVAGTELLRDINSGPEGSDPGFFFVFDNEVHFYAEDNTVGQSIYTTDGTESGTEVVFDMYPNTKGNEIEALTSSIGKLFFTIDDTLWVSDGTVEGSQSLMFEYTYSTILKLGEINGRLIFAYNSDLWATDGTPAGTQQLLEYGGLNYSSMNFTRMGDYLWFFYEDANNGVELYKTDGTLNGTEMAFESGIGVESLFDLPHIEINTVNGKLYFTNDTDEEGAELWHSDGTLDGTMLFMDFMSGISSSTPRGFVNFKNELYFYANTSTSSFLWKTDGTIEGTIELAETKILPQHPAVSIQESMVFFNHSDQLWKTDGTPEGSEMIYDFSNDFNTFDDGVVAYKNAVVFKANSPTGYEPWISDGTTSGTVLLRDIQEDDSSSPQYFTTVEDFLFFAAEDTIGSFHTLYRSDATEEGTYKATDFGFADLHYTENLILHKGRLYFMAGNYTFGNEIYYYDFNIPEKINGEVFHDANNNGIKDANESPMINFPVSATNGDEFFSYTDNEGKYNFYVDEGSYEVSPVLNQCWVISSDSLTYHVEVEDMIASNLDFGLAQASVESAAWVKTTSGPTRCGFTVPFWVDVVNTGCDSISGEIRVEIDSLTEFVSSSQAPDAIDGNTYTWNFEDLSPSHNSKIQLDLIMPDQQFIGDSIHIDSDIYLLENSDLVWADSNSYISIINCAYDPNDKLVEPDRSELSAENYTLFDERLTYTIRFQNTGTDTAFTVKIRDRLSPLLDIHTFEPLAASHPFSTTVYPDRMVEFLFEDILLPDSSVNEPASHGYVIFRINTIGDLDEFSELQNTANIYFDFNDAIVTNTVTNTLVSTFDFDQDGYSLWEDCDDNNADINPGAIEIPNNDIDEDCDDILLTSVNDIGRLNIELFPNPAFESINIILQESYNLDLSLSDPHGKLLFSKQVNDSMQIDLSNLPAGVYFMKITDQDSKHSVVKKIVKLNR